MPTTLIIFWLIFALTVYGNLVFARIILSYLQGVQFSRWITPAINFLYDITDPFLRVFRGLIPPLGGFDLSPLLGFLALRILIKILAEFVTPGFI